MSQTLGMLAVGLFMRLVLVLIGCISELYLRLLRQYFGGESGIGIDIDDSFATEWMSVRLPFGSFETLNWPFAMATACSLVEKSSCRRPDGAKGVR
jgi:hypothetical protein